MIIKLCNDWDNDFGIYALAKDFSEDSYDGSREIIAARWIIENLIDIEWLFGSYSYENYSGNAFVLFKRNGELFEVNGSHCSCYGLFGQWSPESTTIEAILHRIEKGDLGGGDYSDNEFKEELIKFLKRKL